MDDEDWSDGMRWGAIEAGDGCSGVLNERLVVVVGVRLVEARGRDEGRERAEQENDG